MTRKYRNFTREEKINEQIKKARINKYMTEIKNELSAFSLI